MSWLFNPDKRSYQQNKNDVSLDLAAELLGIHPKEVNEPSIKCSIILGQGLQPEICSDFREIRRWVLCRAWELLDSHSVKSFREAIRRAWEEARLGCGGEV